MFSLALPQEAEMPRTNIQISTDIRLLKTELAQVEREKKLYTLRARPTPRRLINRQAGILKQLRAAEDELQLLRGRVYRSWQTEAGLPCVCTGLAHFHAGEIEPRAGHAAICRFSWQEPCDHLICRQARIINKKLLSPWALGQVLGDFPCPAEAPHLVT